MEKTQTQEECLQSLYAGMNYRCSSIGWYIDKGIDNRFLSTEHLTSYVLDTLCIDPRGLHCHRINNDWDYEPDNIEFLTQEEHAMVHRVLHREKCLEDPDWERDERRRRFQIKILR